MARADFTRALVRVKLGMKANVVRALLGEPDDVKTERDPGGIAAARTTAVWRYGTSGHLTFGTLGTVHIQADGTVQYVFGARGAPPPDGLFTELQLRGLLRLLDAVPSYDAPGDPLALIQAVNALQRLGRQRALAAVAEYLRVSSWLDDPGREGTFLVLRALFEVPDPPGYLPAMMVGAPSPPGPADAKAAPRFPLTIVDDIPLKLVGGYSLAGQAQPPEDHLAWFQHHGILRRRPLTPPATPLATLDRLAGAPHTPFLVTTSLDNDAGRRLLLEQGLRLVRTVLRGPLSPGLVSEDAWQKVKSALGARNLVWDAATDRYAFADGSVLPQESRPLYHRAIWNPALRGAIVHVILERSSPTSVSVELRVELAAGATLPPGVLRLRGAPARELLALAITALTAPPTSTAGLVQSGVLSLKEGDTIEAQLTLAGLNEPLRTKLTP